MRQDSFVTSALKASEYIQQNKTYFYGGIAAVIIIVLVVYFVNYSNTQKLVNSEALYGRAQLAAAKGQPEQAIADYKELLEQYASTPLASRGAYYLARIYYDIENYDSALVYFQNYIDNYGKVPMLLGAAYAGAASCYEVLGDYGKAGEYYLKAGETSENDYSSPSYYMSAGRAFREAGLKDEAKTAYQKVIDDYRTSSQYTLARKFIEEVEYANK